MAGPSKLVIANDLLRGKVGSAVKIGAHTVKRIGRRLFKVGRVQMGLADAIKKLCK